MKVRSRAILSLLTALFLTGCATVKAREGFTAVEQTVTERSGMRLSWRQGTAADDEVQAEIRSLLRKELTSDDAVQIALLNNRKLQATYEELNIAQADLVAAGLLRNPIFDAEVRLTAGGGTGLEMGVVQDFIDVLYLPLRKRVAGAAFEAAKLRVTGAVFDLAATVRTAYYNQQVLEQMLEMRRQILAASEAAYILAKRLRAAGNITELDLENERGFYEQAKLDVRSAEVQSVRGRESLNTLLGLWGSEIAWRIAPQMADPPMEEFAIEGLEQLAVKNSLDLALAKREAEQAEAALGIARPFAIFGDVGFGVSAEHESDGEWLVGPAFSLPIPIFNQGQPAVASAQAAFRRSRERYAATAIELRSRTRSAHAGVIAAREQANYYAQILLPLRQRIVNQMQLQYNAMQVGAFQLLQARQQQIDTGKAYLLALRDYWVARNALEQIVNGRMPISDDDIPASSATETINRGGH